jgi:hypothetical protein
MIYFSTENKTEAVTSTAYMQLRHCNATKTNRTKNTTQRTEKMSNTEHTNKPGVNPGAREG